MTLCGVVPVLVHSTTSPTLAVAEDGSNFRSSVSLTVDAAGPLVTALSAAVPPPPPPEPPDPVRSAGGPLPQALSTSTREVPAPTARVRNPLIADLLAE